MLRRPMLMQTWKAYQALPQISNVVCREIQYVKAGHRSPDDISLSIGLVIMTHTCIFTGLRQQDSAPTFCYNFLLHSN